MDFEAAVRYEAYEYRLPPNYTSQRGRRWRSCSGRRQDDVSGGPRSRVFPRTAVVSTRFRGNVSGGEARTGTNTVEGGRGGRRGVLVEVVRDGTR